MTLKRLLGLTMKLYVRIQQLRIIIITWAYRFFFLSVRIWLTTWEFETSELRVDSHVNSSDVPLSFLQKSSMKVDVIGKMTSFMEKGDVLESNCIFTEL